MVKITGGQRIDLLGIPKDKLPDVWRDLGMPSGHAYAKAFRTCKTCVGTEFCRYGVGDSTGLGIAIEKRFQGLESPHKMKLATAGCPRNCSEATTKDVGAVAIEGGRWEIYVGGGAGSKVRKGDVLCTVSSHDEVLQVMGRFMQYYREHARYLERTYDFVERLGIDYLKRAADRGLRGHLRARSMPPSRQRSTHSSIHGSRATRPFTRCSSIPTPAAIRRGADRMSIATSLHQLGPIDRIPLGEARVYRVDGKDIAVFRCRSGNVFATSARMPASRRTAGRRPGRRTRP